MSTDPVLNALRQKPEGDPLEAKLNEALQGNAQAQEQILSSLISYAERHNVASGIPDLTPQLVANQHLRQAPRHNG